LSSGIPDVELDGSTIGVEDQRVNLHTQCCYVFLLKLSRQVPLDKGCLPNTTISYKNELELRRAWITLKKKATMERKINRVVVSENKRKNARKLGSEKADTFTSPNTVVRCARAEHWCH